MLLAKSEELDLELGVTKAKPSSPLLMLLRAFYRATHARSMSWSMAREIASIRANVKPGGYGVPSR